jgi:translation initiation factor IF-3
LYCVIRPNATRLTKNACGAILLHTSHPSWGGSAIVCWELRRSAAIRDRLRINTRIRARDVRLIDEDGTQVGVVSLREALLLAEERGLDLVEVAPNAIPPVCRVMDYGKFRYEQTKKEREARKNQKQIELKEVRLKPKTDDHDIGVKARQARKFLLSGDKVKFTVKFRGREIFHPDIGMAMLEQMSEELRDIAIVEQKPLMEGRALSLMLAPNAKAKQIQAQQQRAAQARVQQAAPADGQQPPAAVADDDDDIDDVDIDDDFDDDDDDEDDEE